MNKFRAFVLALIVLVAMCFVAPSSYAAEYGEVVGAGVSFNQYSNPRLDGNLLYAHRISDGLYSFNLIDFVQVSSKPFTVGVSFTPGVAKRIMTFNQIPVYATVNVGAMMGGTTNFGYSFSSGMAGTIGLGKSLMLMPNFRIMKGSLVDTQYIYGVMLNWGSGKVN
jgi:hypothetical protein